MKLKPEDPDANTDDEIEIPPELVSLFADWPPNQSMQSISNAQMENGNYQLPPGQYQLQTQPGGGLSTLYEFGGNSGYGATSAPNNGPQTWYMPANSTFTEAQFKKPRLVKDEVDNEDAEMSSEEASGSDWAPGQSSGRGSTRGGATTKNAIQAKRNRERKKKEHDERAQEERRLKEELDNLKREQTRLDQKLQEEETKKQYLTSILNNSEALSRVLLHLSQENTPPAVRLNPMQPRDHVDATGSLCLHVTGVRASVQQCSSCQRFFDG